MEEIAAQKPKTHLAGAIGANLFSAAGILLAVILFALDRTPAVTGVLQFWLALTGYKIFNGKYDKKGIFIFAITALVWSILGIHLAYVIYNIYLAVKNGSPEAGTVLLKLKDAYTLPSAQSSIIKVTVISFVLSAICVASRATTDLKELKNSEK